MSDYTVTTNFAAKDALATGNASKQIRGTELDVEFDAIAVAIATKADKANPTFSGTLTAAAVAATTLTASGLVTATQFKETDPVAFSAYAAASQTSGATTANIDFGTESYDLSADFASPTFTAPVDGLYLFTVGVQVNNASGVSVDSYFYLHHSGDGTVANSTRLTIANGYSEVHVMSIVYRMTAGQTMQVRNGGTALSATYLVMSGLQTRFSGKLLSRI